MDAIHPQLAGELQVIWGVLTRSAEQFAEALRGQYTHQGCLQPGSAVPRIPALVDARNVSLDALPTLCATIPSCNWDPWRSNDSCLSSYRSNSFCGCCDRGFCEDHSRPPLCFNPFLVGEASSKDLCATAAGVYAPEDMEVLCYFPDRTHEDCLPQKFCDNSSSTCPPYCFFEQGTASTCDCNTFNMPLCDLLVFDSALNICKIDNSPFAILRSPRSAAECSHNNGTWFAGGVWQEPRYATQDTCPAGFCVAEPSLDQVRC